MATRWCCALLLLLTPALARARPPRPRFEPTELELEDPGVVELDLQVGYVQGQSLSRVVMPDLEIDLGLWRGVELDLDWTYAVEQPFDHSTSDNLWVALKVGLLSARNSDGSGWALGMQVGPRFAAAPGASGAGFEALFLIGRSIRRLHAVLNLGGIADPVQDDRYRPIGLEAGLNMDVRLDAVGQFTFNSAIAAVYLLSPDPHQLSLIAGFTWSPTERFSLSVSGLAGVLSGNDRWAILVGISQKIRFSRPRRR